jgi:hypothetical protein
MLSLLQWKATVAGLKHHALSWEGKIKLEQVKRKRNRLVSMESWLAFRVIYSYLNHYLYDF